MSVDRDKRNFKRDSRRRQRVNRDNTIVFPEKLELVCTLCGQVIKEAASSLSLPESGEPAHFDCVMKKLEESTAKLEKRLKEMKAINRAKGYLIEIENMSEEEAHRYIEKTAMDECVKKIEVAEKIIERYKYD